MRKSVRKVCPRGIIFSNALNSDVFAGVTVAPQRAYNARTFKERNLTKHVAPHELPAKFLLRVWTEDRSPALVSLDQQEVLR
jgi:hypothetical protein